MSPKERSLLFGMFQGVGAPPQLTRRALMNARWSEPCRSSCQKPFDRTCFEALPSLVRPFLVRRQLAVIALEENEKSSKRLRGWRRSEFARGEAGRRDVLGEIESQYRDEYKHLWLCVNRYPQKKAYSRYIFAADGRSACTPLPPRLQLAFLAKNLLIEVPHLAIVFNRIPLGRWRRPAPGRSKQSHGEQHE